jgi:predicted MPP superfamily phosphohydrolase
MILVNIGWIIAVFRLTKNAFWRAFISLFMAVQIAALLILHSPFDWVAYGPKSFLVSVIIWNNVALACGLGALLAFALKRGYGLLRRRNPQSDKVTPTVPAVAEPGSLARRQFLGACAAAAPALFTVGLTTVALKQISTFRLRRMTLMLPTLPRALDGLTIAHVSDMHVGRITCGRILRDLVDTTNDLRADLVLLTGDLINCELSDLSGSLDLVRAMSGRYGKYMIEGNHDLIENAAEFRRCTKVSGIPFLFNEAASLSVRGYPLQIFGLKWTYGHGEKLDAIIAAQLRELMKQRNQDAFPIFLAHHPHALDAAVRENLPLTLSGHTHGGQLMVSSDLGAGSVLFRYWSGLYKREQSQMVVSNGVGNMFPLRLNAPAEVVHLTLRCADARG